MGKGYYLQMKQNNFRVEVVEFIPRLQQCVRKACSTYFVSLSQWIIKISTAHETTVNCWILVSILYFLLL